MSVLRTSISVALVALTLGVGAFGSASPAAAWGYHGGGYHGFAGHGWGGRGFGGHGFGGHGFGGYGWGHGGWHRGGWGGPAAAGVFGGLALGALAAGVYPAYYGCHWEHRPVIDEYGYVVARRDIRVCH